MGSIAEIDAVLRRAAEAGEVPGVVALAAMPGGVVYEGAFGRRDLALGSAMTPDTIFRIASMTKAVTSVAAMQLVEAGKLELDQPIGRVLPELAAPQVLVGFDAAGKPRLRPARRPITLRHLLTHTAGFGYEMLNADLIRYIHRTDTPSTSTGRLASLRLPLLFDPGERWEYGISIDWVGRAVEAVSGTSLDRYFREHIFAPLGMADTGFALAPEQMSRLAPVHQRRADGSLAPIAVDMPPQKPEFWAGGGGLYSTGGDYLRFVRMVLDQGAVCRRPAAAAGNRSGNGREPDRRSRSRDNAHGDAGADQRLRAVSRHALPLGAGLDDHPAAGSLWPQRRQPDLGRDLQQLLLDRPGKAGRRRDPEPVPALRRSARARPVRRVRACGVRGVAAGVTAWRPAGKRYRRDQLA